MIFPPYFDAKVGGLLKDPRTAAVSPAYAFRYFGSDLRMWVDPARLRWRLSDVVSDGQREHWIGSAFVDAANWSGALLPLHRSPVHREMLQLVEAGLDFRRTRAFQTLSRRAGGPRPAMRNGVLLISSERVEDYFHYCIQLARSIQKSGVVPREQLGRFDPSRLRHRAARPLPVDIAERDVGVAVGPRGQLIRHLGGKHRTALAKALSVPRLPVEVRLVHSRWLASVMQQTALPPHKALLVGLRELGDG